MNVLMKLWEDSGSSLWIYKAILKPNSASFSQLFAMVCGNRSGNLLLHLPWTALEMRLYGLNRIGKGVENVEIPSVGNIPAFIGWMYKIATLVQSVAIKSRFQKARKWQNNVWCLAVDTQSKINIEEPEKAETIMMHSISNDFKNWVILKQH